MAAPIQERRRATEDLRRVHDEMKAVVRGVAKKIAALERQLEFAEAATERGADDPRKALERER